MPDPTTTNYGWTKPTVGSDADSWGTTLNANFDGIDTTVFNVHTSVANVSTSLGNVSTSLGNVSTSLGNVSSSLGNVSSSVSTQSTSLSQISSSLSSTNASAANVSTSLGNVSSSLANVSTSVTNVSTSVAALPQPGTNANSAGFLGIPQTSKSADYTLALSDAGTEIYFTASKTLTIPANSSVAFQVGSFVKVSAASGVTVTIAITTDTLVFESTGGTGSRTVTGRGHAILSKETSTEWWASGVNLT